MHTSCSSDPSSKLANSLHHTLISFVIKTYEYDSRIFNCAELRFSSLLLHNEGLVSNPGPAKG